jgi:hypothetical protein
MFLSPFFLSVSTIVTTKSEIFSEESENFAAKMEVKKEVLPCFCQE